MCKLIGSYCLIYQQCVSVCEMCVSNCFVILNKLLPDGGYIVCIILMKRLLLTIITFYYFLSGVFSSSSVFILGSYAIRIILQHPFGK